MPTEQRASQPAGQTKYQTTVIIGHKQTGIPMLGAKVVELLSGRLASSGFTGCLFGSSHDIFLPALCQSYYQDVVEQSEIGIHSTTLQYK